MKPEKVTNGSCRQYVQARRPFTGSNLYGEKRFDEHGNEYYCVFSYAQHWPLFVHVSDTWYENQDRYSTTTSKHRSQSHPLCDTVKLDRFTMQDLARDGLVAVIKNKFPPRR